MYVHWSENCSKWQGLKEDLIVAIGKEFDYKKIKDTRFPTEPIDTVRSNISYCPYCGIDLREDYKRYYKERYGGEHQ